MTVRRTRNDLYQAVSGRSIPLPIEAALRDIIDSLVGGWKDLEMSIVGSSPGVSAPVLAVFGPTGNIKQLKFIVGNSVYLAGHVEHDIKVGSTMYPHVHWTTNGTSTNTVKWEISYVAAAGHNQANFPVDAVITVEEAAQGTAWRHMITEDPVGFPALEIDSIFIAELKRITNGGSENTDDVFGLYMDLHYESQQYGTPGRTPDFYV